MGYREKLPANCPPKTAHDGGCEQAFRFLPARNPEPEHFASNQAKGEPAPPGIDECRWASCSLYADMATVQKKRKLKKLKSYGFVAQLKIAPASGHMVEESKHIDFWMSDMFDPVAAIVLVHELGNGQR